MAKITFYRDDFDGTEDSTVQPRRIPLESGTLTIDLSEENYDNLTAALLKAIEPYMSKGEWTPRDVGGNDENRLIREWGRTNGFDVNPRGRIPEDLVKAYREAHKSHQEPTQPAHEDTSESDNEEHEHTDNGSRELTGATA